MSLLLNWRVWVAIGLAALLAFTNLASYRKGEANVRTEWMASVAAANADARKLEQRRQDMVVEAQKLAADRDARIRADAVSARHESDGLRGDLDSAKRYAAESRAAAERTANLATDLLGRCTESYLGVAEAADRADSEARELRQAWPTK